MAFGYDIYLDLKQKIEDTRDLEKLLNHIEYYRSAEPVRARTLLRDATDILTMKGVFGWKKFVGKIRYNNYLLNGDY